MLAHFVVVGWELQIKKEKKKKKPLNENIPRDIDLCKHLCLEKTHDAGKDIMLFYRLYVYTAALNSSFHFIPIILRIRNFEQKLFGI